MNPLISIVIPTFNEEKNMFFLSTLESLSNLKNIEVIVSDGGSSDNTLKISEGYGFRSLKIETSSRAQRINLGIESSTSELILIHHPRSLIDINGIEFLIQNKENLTWGGFTHSFDEKHPLLNFTSWYSNTIRGKLKGILYLDHCIYLQKEMYKEIGGLPPVDIFEDTILSKKLFKVFGYPKIIPFKSVTSSIRFKTNGVWRQAFINQVLKVRFFIGSNHLKMNKFYEKETSLNSNYNKS